MRPRVRTLAAVLVAFTIIWAGVGLALSGGISVDGTISIEEPSGPDIEVITNGGEMDLSGNSTDGTVEVRHDNGEVVFSSSGSTGATVDSTELEGATTRVTTLDVTSSNLTINPDDKREITVGGGMDSIEFGNATIDNGESDFSYSASSSASLTIGGVPGSTGLIAVDISTGTVVGQTTSDPSGSATFDELDSGSHNVALRSTSTPSLSNGQPSGGQLVTDDPVTLSIDVDDPDFDATQGDNISVTFYDGNGSEIGTDTVTSAGRAQTSWDIDFTGSKSWYAVGESTYGDSTTSTTFSFDTPSDLRLKNESNPDQLVTTAEVEVQFFSESGVVTKNTTDGTISFEGLPAGETFFVQARADGYVTRQAIIESLAEQQTVYLLPDDEDTVDVRFRLNDPTGRFREDSSRIFIEKPLVVNGSTEYRVVAADDFGANGYQTQLERDTRYRIRVQNEAGDSRTLNFQALESEQVILELGGGQDFEFEEGEPFAYSATVTEQGILRVEYQDQTGETDNVDIMIRNQTSDQIQFQDSLSGNGSVTFNVSDRDYNTTTWIAELEISRNGQVVTASTNAGLSRFPVSLPGVPSSILSLVGLGITLAVAGLFTQANATIGAISTSLVAGLLWKIGWMPGTVSGILIGLALFMSVVVHLATNRSSAPPGV